MGNAARQAGEAGRARHAKDFRCAHERHQLRRLRVARGARSYIGGPLALVQTSDMITVDVKNRLIQMEDSDEELARRKAAGNHCRPGSNGGWLFRATLNKPRMAVILIS